VLENEAGPSIARELGGFLEINGSTERIVNSQPFNRFRPETIKHSQVIQPLIASQVEETGMIVATPSPQMARHWKLEGDSDIA
jgi:hypothetical protein